MQSVMLQGKCTARVEAYLQEYCRRLALLRLRCASPKHAPVQGLPHCNLAPLLRRLTSYQPQQRLNGFSLLVSCACAQQAVCTAGKQRRLH